MLNEYKSDYELLSRISFLESYEGSYKMLNNKVIKNKRKKYKRTLLTILNLICHIEEVNNNVR